MSRARRGTGGTTVRAGKASKAVVVARTAAVFGSVTVLGVAGVSWYGVQQLTSGVLSSDALAVSGQNAPPKLDNSENILLIGLDSRKNNDGSNLPGWFVQDELHAGDSSDVGGYNTNSLILLHIPADGTAKVQAVSIPRDDYVMTYNGDGSEQGMHKIKEAYGLAKAAAMPGLQAKGLTGAALEQASREVGREATLTTVQKFLNVHIDHFAEVNLIGFYDIAQAIGPVTVCLNHATSDPAESGQGSGANFHAGYNVLQTPAEALSFVRQRHNLTNTDGDGNGGDFARTHRQQAYITSAETQLKKDGVLSDLSKLQGLLNVVKKDVVIDNQWSILDFAQQAPNLTGGKVTFNTLPITGLPNVYIPGEGIQSVNSVSVPQVQRTVTALFADAPAPSSPSAPKPSASSAPASATTVDVLNASAPPGSAGVESAALVAAGYTKGRVGDHAAVNSTEILYGAGEQAAAQQIASKVGVGAPQASSAVASGHVEVVLASDFTPPAAGSGSSGSGSTPSPASTAHLVFQGPAVNGGGSGIPCVD
ncbi:LCP family protein [Streptacidiphilus fuscans]|uniref:LCP family protein n=1 Tax=Streptacidiphilus fuscans TaxID=2789292 RepID=A0A931FGH0_9ACTN|nr:LCP family protein [Streptacidiphilus fuscans]MBF9072618.1 LCP family protein [Streptacidiphilus fuscans]